MSSPPRVGRLVRYVTREVLLMYGVGLLLFIILQMTDVLTTTVGQAMRFHASPAQFGMALLSIFPDKLNRALVVAIPFAILLGFSRLQRDSELKAALAAGVSPRSLVWPLIVPFVLVGALAFWNAGTVVPAGWIHWDRTWYGIVGAAPPIPEQKNYTYADGERFFYAASVVPETEHNNVGVASLRYALVIRGGGAEVLTAPSGYWKAGKEWVLYSPWVLTSGQPPYRARGEVSIAQTDQLRAPPPEPRKASNTELRKALDERLSPQERRSYQYTLAARYADAFTPLAFALAAGSLGFLLRSRVAAMGVVVVFIAVFYVLWWVLMPQLAAVGALNPVVAAWLPVGLYVLLGVTLAWRVR